MPITCRFFRRRQFGALRELALPCRLPEQTLSPKGPTFGEFSLEASPQGAYFWCAHVIAMDGMYAGFAGANTGHRSMTFCGCAVICFTVFLAIVALAVFCRCYQGTVLAIRTVRRPGEHTVTNSPGANLDSFGWPAKQASIRDDTSKSGQSLPRT